MATATAPAAAKASPAPASAPAANEPEATLNQIAAIARQHGRDDLAQRGAAAVARLQRSASIICVAGEFKQGKSSLVNALLGQDLCPVDDDLATSAITLVRHAEQVSALVRRRDGEKSVAERIDIADVAQWVSEQHNPGNSRRVERVEITSPSPLLKQGLAIVDTPGMGGLGAGHAAATLSFLPFADGLILVSDSSAELSVTEVEFMRHAYELCPSVMFVQTKTDLHPEWPRVLELNRNHLANAGLDIPMVPVSSLVRGAALARRDRDLNERSGVPVLVRTLGDRVLAPSRLAAASRSASDGRSIVHALRVEAMAEKTTLASPSNESPEAVEMQRVKERIEHLKGPGSKWSVLLNDRISDLTNTASFGFRASMRVVQKEMDERIEHLKNAQEWDEAVRDLQSAVADEITATFVVLEQAKAVIGHELIQLIGEEDGIRLGSPESPEVLEALQAMDIESLWNGRSIDEQLSGGRKAFNAGVTTIRGAQGGMYMFGTLGSFLPAAAGALLAANPIVLGIGAIFGGLGIADDRKRKVTQRRQAARTQARQFIDDVQFEIGNAITNLVRDIQRQLRDEIGGQVSELQRSYAEAGQRTQGALQRSQQERTARIKQVEQFVRELDALDQRLASAGTGGGQGG
jgi:hypothetical protein